MASCATCGSTIMFGGRKHGDVRFCSEKCEAAGLPLVSTDIPEQLVKAETDKVWRGSCPVCSGEGPVDVHVSHSVWSALVMTKWSSKPQVSCKPCGRKAMLLATAQSALLGWWGFPWGLLVTPVQIVRNVAGMVRPNSATPSKELSKAVRYQLAKNAQAPKSPDFHF